MPENEEYFEVIDDATGEVLGLAGRSECHRNPSLVHRSVHVAVYHPDGRILLQKRSMRKDIQPGKWDTAVGGHLMPGENYETAARREMREELGLVTDFALKHLADYKIRNERESENIRVFSVISSGPFQIQKSELDEVRFYSVAELKKRLAENDCDDLTPVLCQELKLLFGESEVPLPI